MIQPQTMFVTKYWCGTKFLLAELPTNKSNIVMFFGRHPKAQSVGLAPFERHKKSGSYVGEQTVRMEEQGFAKVRHNWLISRKWDLKPNITK